MLVLVPVWSAGLGMWSCLESLDYPLVPSTYNGYSSLYNTVRVHLHVYMYVCMSSL